MSDEGAPPAAEDLDRWHRTMAPLAFNQAWEFLDQEVLTREEEEAMLAAAFAQRHHWYQVGEPRNLAIADWQVARVAAVLGYADLARRFAERSLDVVRRHDLGPFLEGFAHEALARAAAWVDDLDTFTYHLEAAKALVPEIEDATERELLEADLAEMSER